MRKKYKQSPEVRRRQAQDYRARDPEKWKVMHRRYYERHKVKTLERNWITQIGRLGCTPELYEELLRRQNGVCAICKSQNGKKRLAVDHDHTTGKIRGLLCNPCNTALGVFDDDAEKLQRALDYLNAIP